MRLWRESGAAARLIPELDATPADVLARVGAVGRESATRSLLTALLARDPAAMLRRLKASGAEIERAAAIAAGPESPAGSDEHGGPPVARRRLGKAAADLIALWSAAARIAAPWAATVRRIGERGDPLTRGDLARRRQPTSRRSALTGPRIGELLAAAARPRARGSFPQHAGCAARARAGTA